jgi:GNAT superfamily N-acetyltransferase
MSGFIHRPAEEVVDDYLARGEDGGMYVWEDGAPASMAGCGGPTPNGIRVGPVYTPRERRGRGYASALTAELTALLLASGRRFCFLFTDIANPTSTSESATSPSRTSTSTGLPEIRAAPALSRRGTSGARHWPWP